VETVRFLFNFRKKIADPQCPADFGLSYNEEDLLLRHAAAGHPPDWQAGRYKVRSRRSDYD
jgi:hypothetical protein